MLVFVTAGGLFVGSSNVDLSSLGDSMREMASRIPIVRGLTSDKDVSLERRVDTRRIKKMVSETTELRKELFEEDKDGKMSLITTEPTKEQMRDLKEYSENMRKFKKEYLSFMKGFHEFYFKDTQFMSDGDGKGDWYEEEDCEEDEDCEEEEEGYYTSEPEPPEPEPVLNPMDYVDEDGVFDFFGYVADYIELFTYKPEDYTGDFVWVFPFNTPVLNIDTDTLSPEGPRTASNFIACTLGTQAAMIDSVAFDLMGENGGQVEFEVKAYTMDGEFNILDYPVMSQVYNWPGDLNFPYQISLDPGECMAFSIRYIGAYPEDNPDYHPLWAQFSMRGLGSSLPAYFIEYETDLVVLSDSNDLKGALNVFEYQNGILLKANNGETYFPLEANSYWLGSFKVQTFPNTSAYVESVDFYLDTTYDEPLEVDINFNFDQSTNYYNSPEWKNLESISTTLEPGLNTVYVDFNLAYAERVYMNAHAYIDPEEMGTVTLSLVDVDYDGEKIEGYYDGYPSVDAGGNEVFDGLEGEILHFINMEEGDAFVKVGWYPHGDGVHWISEDELAPDVEKKPEVARLELEHSSPVVEGVNAIEVEDFEFEVFGSFENPVLLNLYRSGYTYFPDEDDWDYVDEYEVGAFDVLPGDVISVGSTTLYSGGSQTYRLRADEFPLDPGYGTVLLGLKVDDLSAHFVEAEALDPSDPISIIDPPEGPSAEVYVWDHETDSYLENFVYPIVYRLSGFAPVLIYKETDSNTPYEMVILSEWEDNDEPYTMNHVCMHAQGGATVYNFTYQHDQRDESPFEEVRLDAWQNIIYLDLESEWSENYATFSLTNPVEYNNQIFCLTLEVALPTEEVNNAWFNLIGIEAMDSEGNSIEVYETYQPPNNNIGLSELHSINGPTVYFLDF